MTAAPRLAAATEARLVAIEHDLDRLEAQMSRIEQRLDLVLSALLDVSAWSDLLAESRYR